MKWKSLVFLLVGNVLWFFANGQWRIDAMAWLFPFFILLFLAQSRFWWGAFLLYFLNYGVQVMAWQGMIPLPGAAYYLILLGMTAYYVAPFIIDRWLRPKIPGFKKTFILPFCAVSLDFLMASLSPYGTQGSLAYSQYDFPQLVQISTLTGLWGITFLLYWFGSIVYHLYQRRRNLRETRRHVVVPVLVYAAVLVFGFVRYDIDSTAPRVEVAGFTAPLTPVWARFERMKVDLTQPALLRSEATEILNGYYDTYFRLADSVTRETTQIILSSEANLPIEKEREPELKARAAEFSRTRSVIAVHGVVVYTKGQPLAENKLLVFDKTGREIAEYYKSYVVPGDANVTGDRELKVLDSNLGKTGLAICFDLDFPLWIEQYGQQRVALLLAPASDWQQISSYHAEMATFRAIENGFSLVRQTHQGRSVAVDGRGKVYARQDYLSPHPHVLQARVPVESLNAFYPYTNDAAVWICLVGLLYFMLSSRSRGNLFKLDR